MYIYIYIYILYTHNNSLCVRYPLKEYKSPIGVRYCRVSWQSDEVQFWNRQRYIKEFLKFHKNFGRDFSRVFQRCQNSLSTPHLNCNTPSVSVHYSFTHQHRLVPCLCLTSVRLLIILSIFKGYDLFQIGYKNGQRKSRNRWSRLKMIPNTVRFCCSEKFKWCYMRNFGSDC